MQKANKTTKQMLDAARGAVYVWCNSYMHYPFALARALHREDLVIVPLHALLDASLIGRRFPDIVVDHAAQLNNEHRYNLERIRALCRSSLGVPVAESVVKDPQTK